MKYLVMIAGLFIGMNSWSQDEIAAVEIPQQNILYRGFENKITPSVTNNGGKEVRLVGTNSKVEKVEGQNSFIVKVATSKKSETLHVVLYDGAKVDTIESIVYQVANLPSPSVYLGGVKSGGIVDFAATKLSIGYPDGVKLKSDFQIVNWEISANKKATMGHGDDLSSAKEFLRDIKSGTSLYLMLTVRGADGILRKTAAQWEVK